MHEQHVRDLYDHVLSRGELDRLEALLAPDFADARGAGPAAFAGSIRTLRAAFPDIVYVVDDVVSAGDRVAARFHWTGTHAGTFQGIPATGKRVMVSGIAFYAFRAGRIAQSWLEVNRLGFFQQLGIVPPDEALRPR